MLEGLIEETSSLSPVFGIHSDGQPAGFPDIRVRYDEERTGFCRMERAFLYAASDAGIFWNTGFLAARPEDGEIPADRAAQESALMWSFDITPDGKQIVFDRLRANSDILLIDLPKKGK